MKYKYTHAYYTNIHANRWPSTAREGGKVGFRNTIIYVTHDVYYYKIHTHTQKHKYTNTHTHTYIWPCCECDNVIVFNTDVCGKLIFNGFLFIYILRFNHFSFLFTHGRNVQKNASFEQRLQCYDTIKHSNRAIRL